MTDRFPTSAELRDAARRLPSGPAALRLLALADALDAGTVRWPEEAPRGTCDGCAHSSDDNWKCAVIDSQRDVLAWCERWCDGNWTNPHATPCPGFADKVTT